MSLTQRILKAILPRSMGEAMEAESRRWIMRCPDGHEISMWDAGAVRFNASGKPKLRYRCPGCGQIRWMTLTERPAS